MHAAPLTFRTRPGCTAPPLIAPPDEGLVDATDDRRDAVYQHRLGIAEGIRAQVAAQGRKRRPDLNQVHSRDEETLAVVEDPRELDWLEHGARNDLIWLKPSVGLIASPMVADLSLPDCKWPCHSGTGVSRDPLPQPRMYPTHATRWARVLFLLHLLDTPALLSRQRRRRCRSTLGS